MSCQGTTQQGTRCQKRAMAGSPYCPYHVNPTRYDDLMRKRREEQEEVEPLVGTLAWVQVGEE